MVLQLWVSSFTRCVLGGANPPEADVEVAVEVAMKGITAPGMEHRLWPQVGLPWHVVSVLDCVTLGKLFNLSKSKPYP